MSQKKLQEYYKDVDTYNSLLNSSVSLFFKSILTYSIAALGLFFTLLVQFFKDRQISDNIINDVFIAVLLLSVCIVLIFAAMLIDQKSISYSLYMSRQYYLYADNSLTNRWVYVFYAAEVFILLLAVTATIFMAKVYMSLLVYNI